MARFASLLAASAVLLGAVDPAAAKTLRVPTGKTIQSVLDQAKYGDKVVVPAGTYKEQLVIRTSGVTLQGEKNAVLEMPEAPIHNECSGLAGPKQPENNPNIDSEVGICILGQGVELDDFVVEHRKFKTVKKRVKGVTVTGMTVDGFSGVDIAVVGAENTRVYGNVMKGEAFVDFVQYGGLTVGSIGTVMTTNQVASGGFIGICMDDISDVHVNENDISSTFIGLCVQTKKADVCRNKVSACVGAFVDPGVDGAVLSGNAFGSTPDYCAALSNFGPFFQLVAGIYIDGAVNTLVEKNTITGMSDAGLQGETTNHAAGVSINDHIADGQPTVKAKGNKIQYNTFKNNEVDILINDDNVKKANSYSHNTCSTAAVGPAFTSVNCHTLEH